ncbi:MAG: phosphopantetheine-binding protein [Neisseria sp.]|nr:phosphopantetheine-binding protein [Neisseria sp.]
MTQYLFTLEPQQLEAELKKLIITESDKADVLAAHELADDEPLFGHHSRLELDSLDALQIAVALQNHFSVRLQGSRAARKHMGCIRDLARFIRESHA